METPQPGVHPRLAQAHLELHSSTPYLHAIRLLDSGQLSAAIPPTHRSSLKTGIEHALYHFHDLGFQAGLAGREPLAAFAEYENSELAAVRQRIEGMLTRLGEDFRRLHREAELKWKATDMADNRKQQYFRQMNDTRRDLGKLTSLDRSSVINRIQALCQEVFLFGYDRGAGLARANERRRRHGLQVEEIHLEVPRLLQVDDFEDQSGTHLSLQ